MQILSVLTELAFFLFSQLVKCHQLHPFDNTLVKGKGKIVIREIGYDNLILDV